MGPFVVSKSQKRYNRLVEVCFLSVNDLTLVGSATFCPILKLSFDFIGRYIILYFFTQRATFPDN